MGIFIGRRKELKKLSEIFRLDEKGSFKSRIVVIEGEAGVGKTRLLERFARLHKDLEIIWTNCEMEDPFSIILRELVKLRGINQLSRAILSAEIKDEHLGLLWERISNLIGTYASSKPLIIILEDLYYAKDRTLDCLGVLARNLSLGEIKKGLGLVITDRGERGTKSSSWIEQLLQRAEISYIKLRSFEKEELARFLKNLLGGKPSKELLVQLARLSGGNPLLAELLLRTFLAEGKISSKDGIWQGKGQIEQVPREIRPLLQRRFSLLEPPQREILNLIAVINRPVDLHILEGLFKEKEDLLRKRVAGLMKDGFLERDVGFKERGYFRLKHGLLRNFIYENLPESKRISLHRRLANRLPRIYGAKASEAVHEIAHHAAMGKSIPIMRRFLPLAAEDAERSFSWEKAFYYHGLLVELLGKEDRQQIFERKLAMARISLKLGRSREGLSLAEELLKESWLGDSQRFSAMLVKLESLVRMGEADMAKEYILFINSTIPSSEHPQALKLLAIELPLAYQLRDHDWLQSISRRGIELSATREDPSRFRFENALCVSLTLKGKLREAKHLLEEFVKGYKTPYGSHMHTNLGLLSRAMGEFSSAEKNLLRAIELSKLGGDRIELIHCQLGLSNLYVMQARFDKALEILGELKRWAEYTNDRFTTLLVYGSLGVLYFEIGDMLSAQEYLERSLEISKTLPGAFPFRYSSEIELARLHAICKRFDKVFKHLKWVEDHLEQIRDLGNILDSRLDLAEIALLCKREDLLERAMEELQGMEKQLEIYRLKMAPYLFLKGIFLKEKGDLLKGLSYLEKANSLSLEIGLPLLRVKILCELYRFYQRTDSPQKSQQILQEVEELLEVIIQGIPPDLRKTFMLKGVYRYFQEIISGRVLEVDSRLVALEKMESSFDRLIKLGNSSMLRSSVLEDLINFSMAKGGRLFLEGEIPAGSAEDDFLKTKDPLLYKRPYLYLALRGGMGVAVLDVGEKMPTEEILEILLKFVKRVSLLLEGASSKALAQERTFRTLERFPKRHTDLELQFLNFGIVGHSEPMQKVYQLLEKIAYLEVPVLLEGETGTGKELFAKAIHNLSPRRKGPFITVECAAISRQLIDSELFGHVKGAFTDAREDHKGLFEMAKGGTIFLDRIDEMAPLIQSKLLRTIEDRKIRKIGSAEFIEVDVRIICAVDRDVERLVREGKLREDLLYRLNTTRVILPPLRERRDDIPLLVEHFLENIHKEKGISVKITPRALTRLTDYTWPGNVRELKGLITRLGLTRRDIDLEDITFEFEKVKSLSHGEKGLREAEKEFTRLFIKKTLDELGWDIPSTARRLDIPISTLYHRIKQLGLKK